MTLCALVGALIAPAGGAHAEFYQWTDAHGRTHLSNVPPRSFDDTGHLRPAAHPWSLAAQRAALAARLAARDAALAAAAEAVPQPPGDGAPAGAALTK